MIDLPWSGWNKYITDTQSEPADDPIFNDVNIITFNYLSIYIYNSCIYMYLHIDVHVRGQYNGNMNTYNNNESSYTINMFIVNSISITSPSL